MANPSCLPLQERHLSTGSLWEQHLGPQIARVQCSWYVGYTTIFPCSSLSRETFQPCMSDNPGLGSLLSLDESQVGSEE